jgi:cytochrome d ubiquinol oxidase subunit II
MSSVAPFWDGNETWLVLGGGGLLAAFPLAYSVMLPALYIPVILMLIGLILRGVAFEFRFKSQRYRWTWDLAFTVGSMLAALSQGAIMGAFVHGFAVTDNKFSGGAFDWLTPFSVLTAAALLSGYVLLSACWLIMKGDEALREWAYGIAFSALATVAAFIVIFSVWTPFLHPEIAARWFTPANMVMLSPVPLATAAAVILLWRALKARQRYTPFLLGVGIFILCYTGLAVSLFPFIVPPDITIWQAAAAEHEPSLVAVPEGRDRAHHGVAVLVRGRQREEYAKAEIVAAEQHVEEHREGQDRRPDQRQDHRKIFRHLAFCAGHGLPEAASGRWERSASPFSGTGGVASGPRCTNRTM